jgi:hypothetical protein
MRLILQVGFQALEALLVQQHCPYTSGKGEAGVACCRRG